MLVWWLWLLMLARYFLCFFFSSRRRHTRFDCDWSSDVCSSDLALVDTARELGLRFHPCRGSMSLGESKGGLPPDSVVESDDAILVHTEYVVSRYQDRKSVV